MFEAYYTYSETDYQIYPFDDSISWRNVWGLPCRSVRQLSESEEGYVIPIPGRYRITLDETSVKAYNAALELCYLYNEPHSDGLTTCLAALPQITAYVDCPNDPDNPYINSDGILITVGGLNRNLVPGLEIEITPEPHYYQMFDVIVGGFWISSEERYYEVLSLGDVQAGRITSSFTLKIKNTSGGTLSSCYAYILNKVLVTQEEMGRPIYSANQMNSYNPRGFDDTTEKEISFDNLVVGTPPEIDILYEDEEIALIDDTGDEDFDRGYDLQCDESTRYRFAEETDLSGLGIILSGDIEETDTADVLVSPGGDLFQLKLSTDTEWSFGNQGLSLGSLDADEEIEVNIRTNSGAGLSTDLNPIMAILNLTSGDSQDSIGLIATVSEETDRQLLIRTSVHLENDIYVMMNFGVSS